MPWCTFPMNRKFEAGITWSSKMTPRTHPTSMQDILKSAFPQPVMLAFFGIIGSFGKRHIDVHSHHVPTLCTQLVSIGSLKSKRPETGGKRLVPCSISCRSMYEICKVTRNFSQPFLLKCVSSCVSGDGLYHQVIFRWITRSKASACCKAPWSWSPVKDGLELKCAVTLEPIIHC